MARFKILGAASIPYIGMLIRCMFKDAPVPIYQLEMGGRYNLYFAVMIVMYCISYFVPTSIRPELCYSAMIFLVAVIAMVQLHWPAQDFTSRHMLFTALTGLFFTIQGIIGADGYWSGFIITLLYFPVWCCVISYFDDSPSGLEHQNHNI